jgi:hypothetical protein
MIPLDPREGAARLRQTVTTDPAGKSITRVSNAAGQLTKVTEPGLGSGGTAVETLYVYEAAGNLTKPP